MEPDRPRFRPRTGLEWRRESRSSNTGYPRLTLEGRLTYLQRPFQSGAFV